MRVRGSAGRTHHELWPQYDPISSYPPRTSYISSLLRTILILQPHFSLVPFRMLFLCYLFRFVALFLSSLPFPPLSSLFLLLLFVLPSASARFPVPATFFRRLPCFLACAFCFNVQRCPCPLPIPPPASLCAPLLTVACPFTFAFIHIHSHSTCSTELTLV